MSVPTDKHPSNPGWLALALLLPLLGGCAGALQHSSSSGSKPPPSASTASVFDAEQDGAPAGEIDVSTIPDAVPRDEPPSKYGNPETYVVFGKTYRTLKSSKGFVERGIASWYGTKFHGRRTSSGEPYSMYAMTAAHKTLPLPTYAEVINLDNGRRIVVKINDRGPFHDGRIIDLSYAAAIKLGINKAGTGRVELRAIDPGAPEQRLAQAPAAVEVQAIAVTQEVAPQPLAQAHPNATENLYLQVGAFSTRLNAENLRNRLQPVAGATIHISEAADVLKPLYRVRIGPFSNDSEALQLASRLLAHGVSNSSIVKD